MPINFLELQFCFCKISEKCPKISHPFSYRFDVAVMNYFFSGENNFNLLTCLSRTDATSTLNWSEKKIEIEFTYKESKVEIDE